RRLSSRSSTVRRARRRATSPNPTRPHTETRAPASGPAFPRRALPPALSRLSGSQLVFLGHVSLQPTRSETHLPGLNRHTEGDLGAARSLERLHLVLDQPHEAVERHDLVAGLAAGVHQRRPQLLDLVDLAHRIGDGRDVHDLWHRRFVAAGTGRIGRSPVERPGTPLLTGAQSPVPEVGERRIAGLERLELEAIDRRGVEALAVPPAYQAFDARPRLPRRPRQAPGKE